MLMAVGIMVMQMARWQYLWFGDGLKLCVTWLMAVWDILFWDRGVLRPALLWDTPSTWRSCSSRLSRWYAWCCCGSVKSCGLPTMAMHNVSWGSVKSWLILPDATHDNSCGCLLLFIEGGATVDGGVAAWDVIDFQFLLQWHSVSEESLVGQVIIVQTASSLSMCTPVEIQELWSVYVDPRKRCFLAEGGGSKLAFRDENTKIDLRCMCGVSFLKAWPNRCEFFVCFVLYHRVSVFFFPDRTTSTARFCIMNK
jgi:hypothetical protein